MTDIEIYQICKLLKGLVSDMLTRLTYADKITSDLITDLLRLAFLLSLIMSDMLYMLV